MDDAKRDPRVVGPWAQKAASARARLVEVPEEALPDWEPDYGCRGESEMSEQRPPGDSVYVMKRLAKARASLAKSTREGMAYFIDDGAEGDFAETLFLFDECSRLRAIIKRTEVMSPRGDCIWCKADEDTIIAHREDCEVFTPDGEVR